MPESDFYVQLVAIDGTLYFPKGGFPEHEPGKPFRTEENVPSMLLRRYDAGDVDTIPWPMVSNLPDVSDGELRKRLAYALYDERETNDFFGSGCSEVLLPDGTRFNFEAELC